MRKIKTLVSVVALVLVSAAFVTACKSSESAYKKAYEKAKLQQASQQNVPTNNYATITPPAGEQPTTTVQTTVSPANDKEVRKINGGVSVISGNGIKTYSVVVGSFTAQANAEGLQNRLKAQGMNAVVIKTTETINGITGWYRVIATTSNDRGQAIASRNALRATYPDAWLLYHN